MVPLSGFSKRRQERPKAPERRQMTGTIRSVKVADVMSRDVVTVGRHTKVKELKELFEKHDFNAFPVAEDGVFVGIVTKLDFMRIFSIGSRFSLSRYRDLFAGEVEQIMREAVVSILPDDSIEKAVEYMVEFGLRSIPVVEGKKLVGMVSRRDVMKHLLVDTE